MLRDHLEGQKLLATLNKLEADLRQDNMDIDTLLEYTTEIVTAMQPLSSILTENFAASERSLKDHVTRGDQKSFFDKHQQVFQEAQELTEVIKRIEDIFTLCKEKAKEKKDESDERLNRAKDSAEKADDLPITLDAARWMVKHEQESGKKNKKRGKKKKQQGQPDEKLNKGPSNQEKLDELLQRILQESGGEQNKDLSEEKQLDLVKERAVLAVEDEKRQQQDTQKKVSRITNLFSNPKKDFVPGDRILSNLKAHHKKMMELLQNSQEHLVSSVEKKDELKGSVVVTDMRLLKSNPEWKARESLVNIINETNILSTRQNHDPYNIGMISVMEGDKKILLVAVSGTLTKQESKALQEFFSDQLLDLDNTNSIAKHQITEIQLVVKAGDTAKLFGHGKQTTKGPYLCSEPRLAARASGIKAECDEKGLYFGTMGETHFLVNPKEGYKEVREHPSCDDRCIPHIKDYREARKHGTTFFHDLLGRRASNTEDRILRSPSEPGLGSHKLK